MNAIKKIFKIRELSSLLFLIGIFAIVGIVNPSFLSATSILNCFNDSVVFTFLAVGIAFVILTGEIDVSIGATLGLSAVISSSLLRDGANWAVAIAAGLITGAVIGLVNGFGVSYLRIPSLIFTLGVNGVIRGLIYVYSGGAWVENLPAGFTSLSQTTIIGVLTAFYAVAIILVILIHLLLVRTKKGKYFIAVGGNEAGAALVGIPANKTKLLSYVLCGVFAAIAGIIYSSRIGFITPAAGNGYEMKAIAACVLGGISLSGGQGSVIGAAIGAVIMSSVSRVLVFLGFSSDYDNTITGILLITIVVIDALTQTRGAVKIRRQRLLARTALSDPTVKGA